MPNKLWLAAIPAVCAAQLRVAPFRADATPELGRPLIWTTPAKVIRDPLLAKGVVLENGRERYVLCALDWCGLGNRTHAMFRRKLAAAAGTDPSRVALQTVHQHTAPYVDSSAYDRVQGLLEYDDAALERVAGRIAEAVSRAQFEPFDRVGTSTAMVEQVASTRRLKDGIRFSTSGKDPRLAAAPEGDIDPALRTITLAHGDQPLVRLHYYATHPQTFCCEGTVTSDVAGLAREAIEREDGVPHIYFTGCAGDVTMGKYNDGSLEAQKRLFERILAAMRASTRSTQWSPVGKAGWSSEPLLLPKRKRAAAANPSADERYRLAISEVFTGRADVSVLRLGSVSIVHLPGEPMLAFQRYAQSLGAFAVAGYGDIAPGYICTDAAYAEGGYEPSASNSGPGAEAALKVVLKKLLAGTPRSAR